MVIDPTLGSVYPFTCSGFFLTRTNSSRRGIVPPSQPIIYFPILIALKCEKLKYFSIKIQRLLFFCMTINTLSLYVWQMMCQRCVFITQMNCHCVELRKHYNCSRRFSVCPKIPSDSATRPNCNAKL